VGELDLRTEIESWELGTALQKEDQLLRWEAPTASPSMKAASFQQHCLGSETNSVVVVHISQNNIHESDSRIFFETTAGTPG
jgi:hypothetical protein